MGAVVCVEPNQDPGETPHELTERFDHAATLMALQDAINALQDGESVQSRIQATGAAAFARLAFFHKS